MSLVVTDRTSRADLAIRRSGRPLRVLIAPHEIAGQMSLLARGLRSRGIEAVSVDYYRRDGRSPGDPSCDVNLGLRSGERSVRRLAKTLSFATWAAHHFDVFHFFYGESLLPRLADLWYLRRLGKGVYVHFRGSDVRSVRQSYHPCAKLEPSATDREAKLVVRWRAFADRLFVSTPDLRQFVPEAVWIPQVIDLGEWPEAPEIAPAEEIVVAHAPTDPIKKGTEHVTAAVEALQREGIRIRLETLVKRPRDEIRAVFARSHIGVDQVIYGAYGNVAIELMASGKPVVANVSRVRSDIPDLPIVHSLPGELKDRLRELALNADLRRQLGREGRAYVERRHALPVVVEDLIAAYSSARIRARVP